MNKNTYKKRNKGYDVKEYDNNGVTWVRVKFRDHGTEIIMSKEEWERK